MQNEFEVCRLSAQSELSEIYFHGGSMDMSPLAENQGQNQQSFLPNLIICSQCLMETRKHGSHTPKPSVAQGFCRLIPLKHNCSS